MVREQSSWAEFWNRGGFWRAVLVVLVYLGLYTLASFGSQLAFAAQIHPEDVFATPESVFFAIGGGTLVGSLLIVAFISTVKWWRPLFARQPVRGSWWMWIAVVIVVVPAVVRLTATDYSRYTVGTVIATFLFVGLLVGFTEELVTRGIGIRLLRAKGHSERVVAVLSAALFALMHLVNAIGTGITPTILVLLLYTFGFGICMYLVMRVTGNLSWAVLLHAITDPTLALANGGIDTASTTAPNPLLEAAGLENLLVIAFGLISIIFIRGRAGVENSVGRPVS